MVVSFAPKITIDKMQSVLLNMPNLARMNPNAGTYVNKGYNPVSFATNANKTIVNDFIKVFEKLGKVPIVSENQIEAYAVISAMGHTYFMPNSTIPDNYEAIPRNVPVIVADSVGLRSHEAMEFLISKGFSNLANLAGGIVDWERDGLPLRIDITEQLDGSCVCQLRPRHKRKGINL